MDPIALRVVELMEKTGLSNKELADRLDLNPAIISHISSGRNKPSLNVIQALVTEFTNVNIEYLLNGKGDLFKSRRNPKLSPEQPPAVDTKISEDSSKYARPHQLTTMEGVRQVAPPEGAPAPEPRKGASLSNSPSQTEQVPESKSNPEPPKEETNVNYKSKERARHDRRLIRVILFYDDWSMEEYLP